MPKAWKIRTPRYLLSLVLLSCLFYQCEELIEGCLDVNSINYAFDADRRCDDCCVYPSINLRLNYKVDTFNYSTQIPFVDQALDSFTIPSFEFLVSDIRFYSRDLDQYFNVSDSISYLCGTDLVKTTDAHFRYTNSRPLGSMFNLRTYTDIDSILFTVGIDSCLTSIDPMLIADDFMGYDNILPARDSLGKWTYQRWSIVNAQDTLSIVVDEAIPISIESSYRFEAGENINLNLDVDLQSAFSDLLLVADDSAGIAEKIRIGLQKSFTFQD